MKCSRQKPENYWKRFGRGAANMGHTVEWATGPVKPEHVQVKEWIAAGHAEQTARIARRHQKQDQMMVTYMENEHE